jgi:hypothetical protein
MSIENIQQSNEFDYNIPHELERKFMPLYPERLERYRTQSFPVEQY